MQPNTIASKTPQDLIVQRAHDHAVQFGGAARYNNLKSYPFFYNFIKYPYQEGHAANATGIYTITGASAEGPDGLSIAPGGILDVPVIMDNDLPFHLLYIKYGAFAPNTYDVVEADADEGLPIYPGIFNNQLVLFTTLGAVTGITINTAYYVLHAPGDPYFNLSTSPDGAIIPITFLGGYFGTVMPINVYTQRPPGSREYLIFDNTNNNPTPAGLFNADRNTRLPYWADLDVSVYFTSSGGRDLYGGFQREPVNGAVEEQPIPLLDLQGNQDGIGMVRTPYQLAKSATVWLRFRSRSKVALRVYGHLFGYKITI